MWFLINCIEHNSKFLFDLESFGVRFCCRAAQPRWCWSGGSCNWWWKGRRHCLVIIWGLKGHWNRVLLRRDIRKLVPLRIWGLFCGYGCSRVCHLIQLTSWCSMTESGEEKKYPMYTQSCLAPNQALSDHYGAHSHLPLTQDKYLPQIQLNIDCETHAGHGNKNYNSD